MAGRLRRQACLARRKLVGDQAAAGRCPASSGLAPAATAVDRTAARGPSADARAAARRPGATGRAAIRRAAADAGKSPCGSTDGGAQSACGAVVETRTAARAPTAAGAQDQ